MKSITQPTSPSEKSLKRKRAYRRRLVRLYDHQDGRCFYCDCKMYLHHRHPSKTNKKKMATIEHIVPASQGGTTRLSNVVISCNRCNRIRGVVRHELFKKLVEIYRWNEIKEMCVQINNTAADIKRMTSRPYLKPKIVAAFGSKQWNYK
jgi:CRISPR/Cas system Type II protein with McrA/HNH and RuvC-like nuclease domain